MATFADIKDATDSATMISFYRDNSIPDGFFVVTTRILGLVRTYLLEGEIDEDENFMTNAEIKGVVVIDKNDQAFAYKGSGIMGGSYMGSLESYEKSFSEMAA